MNLGLDDLDRLYIYGIATAFILSCFFAAVETALLSLTRVQSDQLASDDGFLNRSLRTWIKHPNRLLTTILVADTLMDTATATLTASFFILNFPQVHILLVTSILTIVMLLFAKIIPKMMARAYAPQTAPLLCRLLLVVDFILYPIAWFVSTGISKLFTSVGLRLPTVQRILSGDIESMVDLARREGSVEDQKTQILSSVFDFSKRRVKEIMIPRDRIVALSINTPLRQVIDKVKAENHSRYPVYDRSLDRIVGFLHARDLYGIISQAGLVEDPKKSVDSFSLRTCLRRAFFVSESMMISRVLQDMKSHRIHLAIVKDEWGNVVGLVTLEDILEEVFGDIEDEHDESVAKPVEDLYGAGVEVDGGESLIDLSSRYGIEIDPGESYSTLNGFLQHYTSHHTLMPKMIIIWNKYVFSILSVKDGEAELVRITEIPSDESED